MGRLLICGLGALMIVGACDAEGARGPRVPNLPWLRYDAGMVGGELDAGFESDGAIARDAGARDAALGALDADLLFDAKVPVDGQLDASPDATQPDASAGDAEAGSDGHDGAAGEPDAGSVEPDAGSVEPDAGAACGYLGLVAGNDCPGVVSCQDNGGVPVPACELREPDGTSVNRCCIYAFGTGSNSCRSGSCGLLAQAACDGPEDCAGGKLCCHLGLGVTSCEASCAVTDQLCHRDSDCPAGRRCRVGSGGGLHGYEWWGFCRSEQSGG